MLRNLGIQQPLWARVCRSCRACGTHAPGAPWPAERFGDPSTRFAVRVTALQHYCRLCSRANCDRRGLLTIIRGVPSVSTSPGLLPCSHPRSVRLSVSPVHNAGSIVAVLHSGDLPTGLEEITSPATLRTVTADELSSALPGADVLLVWDFLSDAVRPAWPAADALRWVHTASAGVDRVAFPELLESEVVLTNSRGVFDVPMAEYVLGLVLAFAKDLPGTLRRQDRRRWEHRETERVAGRSAVVVGSGPIGRAVGRVLAAAGLRVELVGRVERDGDPEFGTVHAAGALDGLLPVADFLVLAAPLTEQTRGMIDAAALARMKPTARLINVSRGPLVVTEDLIAALADGRLAGAALDVFESEPLAESSPLWELAGVIVSPHMSGDVLGWRDELAALFADNLDRYRSGRPLRNVVDKARGYVTTDSATPDSVTTDSVTTETATPDSGSTA
ncbi:MAG: D-2-hydroxyacid dehydrogenase [Pseudonocardiaceae bacterium]|nr:D-2-hydroxyacid dehydrogenase [Pseudonocardiaceae bacterium]